jgi:hypothetical protein
MRRMVMISVLLAIFAASAFAQLTIVSSSPVNGAVSVPLTSSLILTFSEPLDTAIRFDENDVCLAMLAHDPGNALSPQGIRFSEDLTVMTIDLLYDANTDFTICVSNAHSQSGDYLAQPFGVCYTTAAEHGPYSISGTVSYGEHSPQYSIVALSNAAENSGVDKFALGGVVVMSTDGSYTVNYVRDGVYWPIVLKDLDLNGDIDWHDVFGYYDPNADGVQDSLIINGVNAEGIDLTLGAISAVNKPATLLPESVVLAQNYPNPFNSETVIAFTLPRAMNITLTVFDLLGRDVATLVKGPLAAGGHELNWNAGSQPGGIYFYRLDAGDQSVTRKMLFVK